MGKISCSVVSVALDFIVKLLKKKKVVVRWHLFIMIKVENQIGKQIIATGAEGSHIRNKEVFILTMPKLIQRIRNSNAWSDIKDTTLYRDLEWQCEDDNIPKEKWRNLINSAFYYIENGE